MTPKEAVENKIQANAGYWAKVKCIKLQASKFSFENHEYQIEPMGSTARRRCYMKATQGGWPLAIDTPVLTDSGWRTMETISIDDSVFGSDGKMYHVIDVHPIKYNQECYKVKFSDGSEIVCDGEHLWTVDDHIGRNKKSITIRTSEMAKNCRHKNRNRYAIPVTKPLEYNDSSVPISPYILGLWLGDGNSYSAQITCSREDSIEYGKIFPYHIKEIVQSDKRNKNIYTVKLKDHHCFLENLRVLKNKHIPYIYKTGSYSQRLELLQGLMDSDGHITRQGKCEWYNINEVLINDVYDLVLSLGFKATVKKKALSTSWDYKTPKDYYVWRITFRAYNDTPVAKLPRKSSRQKPRGNKTRESETERRRIVSIDRTDTVPVRCIAVDSPDHLFLAGRTLIPTHNTEIEVLRSLHAMIFGHHPQGDLYMFPTTDDVQEFSKSRFNPLISSNREAIGKFVKSAGKGTDTASLKKIGSAFLYLRGARLSQKISDINESSKLRGIPVDSVKFDELDMMHESVIAKARGRMGHSDVKEEVFLSNPLVPGEGIDKIFADSDQRYWWRKCGVCGEWTCAEKFFIEDPERCVGIDRDGRGYIACKKCGRPVPIWAGPGTAQWVPDCPSNSSFMHGYQHSQLTSAKNDPVEILNDFLNPPEGNLADVYRLRLGLPYIAAEDRLTKAQVLDCCTNAMPIYSDTEPNAMGVDVGKIKHVVIGSKIGTDRYEIKKVARLSDWDDIMDLATKFNVKSAVVDIRPYEDSARGFQRNARFRTYLCEYKENAPNDYVYRDFSDGRPDIVMANRTQIFDATHRLTTESGRLTIPRYDDEIEEFAKQMCGAYKVLETNNKTGTSVYRYKGKNEHYRNALNYFVLAARPARFPKSGSRGSNRNRQTKAVIRST